MSCLVQIIRMHKLKNGVRPRCIRKSGIVDFGLVELEVGSKALISCVFVSLKHAGTCTWVFTHDLFYKQKHACLFWCIKMHLEQSKSLHKRIDYFSLELPLLHENQMSAFEKSEEVTHIIIKWLLKHPLDDCV